MQQAERQQLAAGEEAVVELHEGTASHVTLRRGADGTVTLQGAGLWNIRWVRQLPRFLSAWLVVGAAAPCCAAGAVLHMHSATSRLPLHVHFFYLQAHAGTNPAL